MNIVIAGSRGWNDQKLLSSYMDYFIEHELPLEHPSIDLKDIRVISGTARGADRIGERWAESRDIEVIRMPADWATHGRSAGYIRNREMAEIADRVFIFWDGVSRGSKHMHDIAKELDIRATVILPNANDYEPDSLDGFV